MNTPLFTELPTSFTSRTCGVEIEFGTDSPIQELATEQFYFDFRCWLSNGGRRYIEQTGDHIEFATPEISNAVEVVAYSRALMALAQKAGVATLYANNRDYVGDVGKLGCSYGCHENYKKYLPRNESDWVQLISYLKARILFCGNGYVDTQGKYEISQRAAFIEKVYGTDTTNNRAFVGSSHSDERLHIITGDTNMCQMSWFLKIGLTSLAVELLERNKLPKPLIHRDPEAFIVRYHKLSKLPATWLRDEHCSFGEIEEIGYLWEFLAVAKAEFLNRDKVTDTLLVYLEDTLEKLEYNPLLLDGRVDWVTKLCLIRLVLKAGFDTPDEYVNDEVADDLETHCMRSLDLRYHALDPNDSLFFPIEKAGLTEMIVSPKLISLAEEFAPQSTRAYVRGLAVRRVAKLQGVKIDTSNEEWDSVKIDNADSGLEIGTVNLELPRNEALGELEKILNKK